MDAGNHVHVASNRPVFIAGSERNVLQGLPPIACFHRVVFQEAELYPTRGGHDERRGNFERPGRSAPLGRRGSVAVPAQG